MKLSLKFREETKNQTPLLRAKIPVTILGQPFLSGIVAGDSSDLSFSLRSNFSTGPSLSLSYHPTTTLSPSSLPFSVSLKSGIGLFGSPHNSPLIFTASFNFFSNTNPNPNSITPTFSLHFKPQFGNFALFKSVNSGVPREIRVDGQGQNGDLPSGSVLEFGNGDGLGDGSGNGLWRDLKRGTSKGGILSGIFVAARTSMPVMKRAVVNFRWGVDFPSKGSVGNGSKAQLPVLVVNKISLERVEEEEGGKKRKVVDGDEAKGGDLELLKGTCGWMRREVEDLKRENREMKQALEGMRLRGGLSSRGGRGEEREGVGKRGLPSPSAESSSEFERWRSRKGSGNAGVEDNGHKESSKQSNKMSDVESELQKAIKAASL